MRAEDQERILTEVRSRNIGRVQAGAGAGGKRLDEVLADSVYHEMRRLKEQKSSKERDEELEFYRDVRRQMRRASEGAQQSLIGDVVTRYSHEIAGNFDPRIYNAVTRVGTPALGLLLNAVSPKRLLGNLPDLPTFDDAIEIVGELEHLRRLKELGTVILVPTHVSNMDSIIVGYALYRLGFPPFIYGAGLNLFENPLVGFFMHNLGAYTVDRRKKDPLYKEVLKDYATLTLEHDYDNIFFPGGTRSRSGAIERRLKLGLLGTGVTAYINNLKRQKPRSKIFIVPATLSFQLVLEAETLIDDFLKESAKSRYIITDDEFSRPKRVVDFMRQLFGLDSKIYFKIGRGFDPFGNEVDDEGNSLDPCGRVVDPSQYVVRGGEPVVDARRDAEYTREVGERISEAFMRDNIIQATHVTSHAALNLFRSMNRDVDLVRLIRAGGPHDDIELGALYQEVERLLEQVRGLKARGGISLGPVVERAQADDIVADALKHFSTYHQEAALTRKGDRVFPTDRALLLYYSNRLEGYRFERSLGLRPALTPDHRSIAPDA